MQAHRPDIGIHRRTDIHSTGSSTRIEEATKIEECNALFPPAIWQAHANPVRQSHATSFRERQSLAGCIEVSNAARTVISNGADVQQHGTSAIRRSAT
jgi:hypothetical protein